MHARHRLVSSGDFDRVRRTGQRFGCPRMMLQRAEASTDGIRLGIVVGRRVGGAVTRNRTRRVLREAAREVLPRMSATADIVVVATRPLARLEDAREALEECAHRAGLLSSMEGTPS